MRAKEKKASTEMRTLYYFWQVTKTQKGMFFLGFLASLMYVGFLTYANSYLMGEIVDQVTRQRVTADQVIPVFGPYVLAILAVNVLGQVGSKLQDYVCWKMEIKANYDLATMCFDKLSNQSMSFHSDQYGGSLVSATSKFMGAYTQLIEQLIYAVSPLIFSVVLIIATLVGPVPYFVLFLVILLIIYTFVAYLMYRQILVLNADAADASNDLSGELSDAVSNILSVKTYGREEYERSLFDKANRQLLKVDSKRMVSDTSRGAMTSSLIVVIMMLMTIFMVGGNAWWGISAGTLVMMFTYTFQLTMRFNMISSTMQHLNRVFGDAESMTLILDAPTLVQDLPDAKPLEVAGGSIDFCDITFRYEGEQEQNPVFDHFFLQIKAGERVGLVGRSGAGKSTLTKLLLRLSDLQEGRILVDGQDISRTSQQSLRRQIAYVPQEGLLFHRSIRENIAYGRPEATDEMIRQAAQEANALEFIERLPQGFDTMVGERGMKLSGGQRQRVIIARAILADAPILVLDEATSALDSESEKLVQEAMEHLMQGRTAIVVAHRLSTVASLDRIVVVDGGKVAEEGSHEALLRQDGVYAQLWNRQTGGFLEQEM